MKKDLVNGILAAGFGVLVYLLAGEFARGGASLSRNPAFYPRILAVVVFGIGVVLIVRSTLALASARRKEQNAGTRNRVGAAKVGWTALILVAYVGTMYVLGFVISTAAFMFVTPLVLGTRLRTALIIFLPATAVLYVVFFVLFQVPIPSGIVFQ